MKAKKSLELCRERVARGTLRTVWSDGQRIIKQYRRVRWPGDTRRPWMLEHRCLARLNLCGVPAPASFGIDRVRRGVILHQRQFVPGTPLTSMEPPWDGLFADHLCSVHGAGVTTNDIALDNMLITEDGRMMCVDYGRGRTFRFKSPLFYFYVGKELARTRRRIFPESPENWVKFCRRYRENARYPSWGWHICRISTRYWLARWKIGRIDPDGTDYIAPKVPSVHQGRICLRQKNP